jgi:NADP-dependent 3-hydroxy acid dehydrogenase YdfG
MTETNFSVVRFKGDKEKAGNVYKGIKPLTAMDIAEAVYFTASVKSHVQINEITITPVNQASPEIVHKKK